MTDPDPVRAALDAAEDIDLPETHIPGDADVGGDPAPPSDTKPDDPENKSPEGARLPLNDTGNGARFALYCGDDVMFVPRVGWHVWDGRRWKIDPDDIVVRRHAQSIQRHIIAEIPHLDLDDWQHEIIAKEPAARAEINALLAIDSEDRTPEQAIKVDDLTAQLQWIKKLKDRKSGIRADHRSFAKTTGNNGRIDALMKESITSLARDVEDLDAHPLTINTQSGLLSFHVTDMSDEGGGKVAGFDVLPHTRTTDVPGRNAPQYITKMIPADYDPQATCPDFRRFLNQIMPDRDMQEFLQRWFGLSMTALPVQKFLYCYGMGANGKSLLANLMRRMLGDYATMVKIESLTGQNRKSGSDATPDLMKLIGARAAITNEPEEGQRLQEQKVKEMTGGDAMLVRNLHADFVEFTPYFKLCFTGNHKLEIRGTDDGIWRRPLLCPFNVQIPERDRDEKLGDKLFETERDGILNWMIEGLIDYLEGGLQEPPDVLSATEQYRRDSDPIGDFLTHECIVDGGPDWIKARDLIDACYYYQLENEAHAWTPNSLGRKLKERAGRFRHPETGKTFERHKRGVTGYIGISLTPDMADKIKNAARDSKHLPLLPSDQDSGPPPPADAGDF